MTNKNISNKRNLPVLVVIQSLLVGFFAVTKAVNWTLASGGFVSEGVLALLYPPLIGSIIAIAILQWKRVISKLKKFYLMLAVYLVLFYYYTMLFIGPPLTGFSLFLVFTVAAFMVPHFSCVDTRLMIKAMMLYPSFAILRLESVFQTTSIWSSTVSMDASYGFLVPIIANLVYLYFYFKTENRYRKITTIILSMINFVFLLRILVYGSRGVVLSIALLFVFLFIVKNEGVGVKINLKRLSYSLFSLLAVLLLFNSIFKALEGYFQSHGISLYFVGKIVELSEQGNITNGREYLNTVTWRGIMEEPFLGHGLDRFAANTKLGDVEYPHNFFLQLFYDGGLFLLTIICVPVIINVKKVLKKCTRDEFAMFVTLFFSSVPGACFSGNLWKLVILWLFFGFLGPRSFVYKCN